MKCFDILYFDIYKYSSIATNIVFVSPDKTTHWINIGIDRIQTIKSVIW